MSELAALDTVIQGASGVRVTDGGVAGERALGANVLVKADDAAGIAALRAALAVGSVPGAVCMCRGDVAFEFFGASGEALAVVGLHHGVSVRWSGWAGDAVLVDGWAVLRWLADRGADGPLRRFEEDERRRAQADDVEVQWRAAVPVVLGDLTEQMIAVSRSSGGTPSDDVLAEIGARLTVAFPDPAERTLALLAWNGAGTGRCSGCPSYELIPGLVLKSVPMAQILAALQSAGADSHHRAGATRHLVGWKTRSKQQRDVNAIPAELKAQMLDEVRASGDGDKIDRAERWLK